MRFILICLLLISFAGWAQKKPTKKQKFYQEYWENEAKKEKYNSIFKEAENLFAQENYYGAIEKYHSLFQIFPSDQQATARINDIEIILAAKVDSVPKSEMKVTHIPQQKIQLVYENKTEPQLNTKPSEVSLNEINDTVKSDIKTETTQASENQPITKNNLPKPTENPKQTTDFRIQVAQQYPDGFTEEIYEKGNRKITKRVLVKNNLGDEYLKVVHPWGGEFYFKNGEPITQFIWQKETEVERPQN